MDFRHLIVTCLFSKLRLPFDNQKVKENYAILCIKTDESINLYSFYKGLCPDKDILSICIPIRIFELGLWEEGSLMYMTNEDYYNLSKEILVKHEAGELTENQIEEIIGSVIIKEWIIDIKPTQ